MTLFFHRVHAGKKRRRLLLLQTVCLRKRERNVIQR